jgi:succinoglycan biosynthesis transport protein ExoP
LYETFLQRYTELVQQQSFPISEARLISPATPPTSKSYPSTSIVLGISTLLAGISAFGAGWLRDKYDRTFHTNDEVQEILGLDCLAIIPIVKRAANDAFEHVEGSAARDITAFSPSRPRDTRHRLATLLADVKSGDTTPRIINRDATAAWTAIQNPLCAFSESMRSLKLALDLHGLVKPEPVVGFTSSLPNEGKSTVAVSLAQTIALAGGNCILLDCDLRNPSLSRQLAPDASRGLLDVLSGKCAIEDAIWKDDITKLDFLPMVAQSRLTNTGDILTSHALEELFATIRQRYNYVIVDFSPISPIIDVRATKHLVDAYIYVVEWGVTKTDVVEYAMRNAPEIRDNTLGIVLNKVDTRLHRSFVSKYKDYHSDKYHERYGYLPE